MGLMMFSQLYVYEKKGSNGINKTNGTMVGDVIQDNVYIFTVGDT